MGEAEIRALEEGRAFVDLSSWRKVAVTGSDAVSWLNDLVSNRVDDVGRSEARRTLLLSRTGHVKADFHVVVGMREGLLIVQAPDQEPVQELLGRYVLSSDVSLTDRTEQHRLHVVADTGSHPRFAPFPFEGLAGMLDAADGSLDAVPEGALEAWRIRRGLPRFGVDLGDDALPAEAGWDALIDRTKGCFLGQEAVAKVRNLGHPAKLVVSLGAGTAPRPGEAVLADGKEAGRITGVAPDGDGYAVLARIRWDAGEADLRTEAGARLIPR